MPMVQNTKVIDSHLGAGASDQLPFDDTGSPSWTSLDEYDPFRTVCVELSNRSWVEINQNIIRRCREFLNQVQVLDGTSGRQPTHLVCRRSSWTIRNINPLRWCDGVTATYKHIGRNGTRGLS